MVHSPGRTVLPCLELPDAIFGCQDEKPCQKWEGWFCLQDNWSKDVVVVLYH